MRDDEAWRFECEVRFVCALGGISELRSKAYLQDVIKKRGEEAAKQLREAAIALWLENKRKGTK